MGRIHNLDERGEHEGYVIGYVPRDWVPVGSAQAIGSTRPVAVLEHYGTRGVLRELGLLDADHAHDIHGVYVVGYACACGWRSPYRELGTPLEWSPSSVHYTEWLEELLAKKWWAPHVRAEIPRAEQVTRDHNTSDSVHVGLDLPHRVAADLAAFFSALGNDDFNRVMQRAPVERAESALLGIGELEHELELVLRALEQQPASSSEQPPPSGEERQEQRFEPPQLRVVRDDGARSRTAANSSTSAKTTPEPSAQKNVVPLTDEHSLAERFIDELETQRAKRAATSMRWGESATERMKRLCRAFPTLRGVPGTDPWDVMHLLGWLCTSGGVTTGNRHAAKFVLQVWNNSTDWAELAMKPPVKEGLGLTGIELAPFNVVQALAVWDPEHENAFRAWCELPFWP